MGKLLASCIDTSFFQHFLWHLTLTRHPLFCWRREWQWVSVEEKHPHTVVSYVTLWGFGKKSSPSRKWSLKLTWDSVTQKMKHKYFSANKLPERTWSGCRVSSSSWILSCTLFKSFCLRIINYSLTMGEKGFQCETYYFPLSTFPQSHSIWWQATSFSDIFLRHILREVSWSGWRRSWQREWQIIVS